MSMFNSYWKCNYDELITFYPRFYREVFEMDAILRAEGRLADGIQSGIDKMLMNNFIDGADEDTLAKLEAFLGFSFTFIKQRTLENRRRFIKTFFVGMGKISASKISKMIKEYTGADTKCEFYPFDSEKNNRLDIRFERGKEAVLYISDIFVLLAKMLPAHIEYRAMVVYRFGIGVDKRITNYQYAYDLCGTKPYSILIAKIEGISAATRAESNEVIMNYRSSKDGGTEPQTGLYPQVTALAHNDTINAATEAVASACGVNYIPCGTTYTR